MSDIEDVLQGVEQAVRDVEIAVNKVESAVNGEWSTFQWIGAGLIVFFLWSLPAQIWHSKWRYALSNGLTSDRVSVDNLPHECAFIAAPMGEKYCHYERVVTTRRWATSTTGNPIMSDDDGKTWSVFTPEAGVNVPQYSTVEELYITWKRVED